MTFGKPMGLNTEITCFDDLLRAARERQERLLLVFAGVELPTDATPEQRARFAQGEGGALVPLMCVDKPPEELASFDALRNESLQFENPQQPWRRMFAAALAGTPGQAPSDGDIDRALQRMVDAVKAGTFSAYLPFNRDGLPVQLGHQ